LKTALILGSNSDIARSAMELLAKDYFIVGIDRTVVDLAKFNADARLQEELASINPDVIINCAGIFGDNTLDYDLIFDVNLKSNWSVIKYYIDNPPHKEVRFIMLGSSVYKQGRRNFILYAASKAALFNMWQGASEFVDANFKLGLINPVHVNTKLVAHRPHKTPEICLEPIDVAIEIKNLCSMQASRYIDIDYKRKD